jgi:membrane protein implicated in regulation of membrane protease activity
MKSSLLAIRSIGTEFANRLFYPVVITGVVAAAALTGLVFWLTTLSSWWWLLFIPVVMAICVGLAVFIIIKLVIRSITPSQTRQQKQAAKQFVDKIQTVAEATQTPKVVLLFRIVRDIAAPKERGFIGSLATTTTSLKSDYTDLVRSFNK